LDLEVLVGGVGVDVDAVYDRIEVKHIDRAERIALPGMIDMVIVSVQCML
jgi:hypothetical protein